MSSATFSIGELATRTGKPATAIRYYEQIGVLPAPPRESGRRVYSDADVRRLRIVESAQRGGLSLDEIRLLLAGTALRDIARARIPVADAELARAQEVRDWLDCASACACEPLEACPLF